MWGYTLCQTLRFRFKDYLECPPYRQARSLSNPPGSTVVEQYHTLRVL